jgi:hypothetical protein
MKAQKYWEARPISQGGKPKGEEQAEGARGIIVDFLKCKPYHPKIKIRDQN